MKRAVVPMAVGLVGGAALVGGPAWAMAGVDPDSRGPGHQHEHDHGRQVSRMMSDAEMRDHMKHCMAEMMSDPSMREQMRSMMSGRGMSMMDQGSMPMMNP
jgi:hypothetical protein